MTEPVIKAICWGCGYWVDSKPSMYRCHTRGCPDIEYDKSTKDALVAMKYINNAVVRGMKNESKDT